MDGIRHFFRFGLHGIFSIAYFALGDGINRNLPVRLKQDQIKKSLSEGSTEFAVFF